MSSMLDIIAAMLIGSILLLVSIRAMDAGLEQFVNYNIDAIVQNELINTTDIMQFDLRKMGFGIPENEQATIIQSADSTHVHFLISLNYLDDAIPDTIEYSVFASDTATFVDTMIVIYAINRTAKISGESTTSGYVGAVANNNVFRFLDQSGTPTTVLQAIRMVEVSLVAMNPKIYTNSDVLAALNPQDRMIEIRKLAKESYMRHSRVVSKNLRR